jgi:hypothetical protein
MPAVHNRDERQNPKELDLWQRSRKPGVPAAGQRQATQALQQLDDFDDLPFEDLGRPAPPWPPPAAMPPQPRPAARQPQATRSQSIDASEDPDFGDRPTPIVTEPLPSGESQVHEMATRFAAKDYRSALVLAENILAAAPADADAKRCAADSRKYLAEKYLARLGGPTMVPRIVLGRAELRGLSLDHRAGFLLSSIDGVLSIEEIIDVSSMAELDALRLMFELAEQGAIVIEPPRRLGRR